MTTLTVRSRPDHAGSALRRTLRRVRPFARRAWVQQGPLALALSAVVGAVSGTMGFLGSPELTTLAKTPGLLPTTVDQVVSVHDAAGALLPITSYVVTLTPMMLGMMVALVATLTLPGVIADDVRGGGIEVLLAGPIPRRSLFAAYLGAALWLTAGAWAAALVSCVAAAVVTAWSVGASVSVTGTFVVAMVVVPLSMGLWSAAATLFGALLYPASLDSRAGLNGGPIRLVAVLPSLLVMPAVMFLPDLVLPALGGVLVVTVAAAVVVVRLTARGFRSTRVLGT